tara:strand:+ start:2412 stop:2585 length:174 start_codon:yes stop_codon:yes gene_type:complete
MQLIQQKISFICGFLLTSLWTMPLMEIGMAFVLGLVGGVGGLVGRLIFNKIDKWKNE